MTVEEISYGYMELARAKTLVLVILCNIVNMKSVKDSVITEYPEKAGNTRVILLNSFRLVDCCQDSTIHQRPYLTSYITSILQLRGQPPSLRSDPA